MTEIIGKYDWNAVVIFGGYSYLYSGQFFKDVSLPNNHTFVALDLLMPLS